jgi:hypothetical protein
MARHCRNRNWFVHDISCHGFALKQRKRAPARDLNATAKTAGKYYNHMKKQQKKTATICA